MPVTHCLLFALAASHDRRRRTIITLSQASKRVVLQHVAVVQHTHAVQGLGQARDIAYNNSKEQAKMYFGVVATDEAGNRLDTYEDTSGWCVHVEYEYWRAVFAAPR